MNNTPHYSQEAVADFRLPGGWTVTWHHAALAVIAALTLWRLWYVSQLELIADESYYFLWSRHLDWSYYSKGPGVALVIWLGTHVFGDTVFGIRCGSVALSAGTAYCLYRLGRKLFGGAAGFFALLLAVVTPLFAIGSVLMTIDPVSVFFWTAAALAFWRAKDEVSGSGWWLLTGLLVGLGMLAKYTNIAELFCFALFCACSPAHRQRLWQKNFWLMTLAALVCLTPVVIWNYQHDWITVRHLWTRGSLDKHWQCSFNELWKFAQLLLAAYSPLFVIGILAAAVAGFRRWRDTRFLFLQSLFWPLLLFYATLSLNKAAEANWVVPCFVSGFVLAVMLWWHWLAKRKVPAGLFVTAGVAVALTMTVAITIGAWWRLPLRKDPLDRVRGWASLGAQVYELQKEHGATFVIAPDYGTASLVSFYLPHKPRTYLVSAPGIRNQYSFWSDYSDGFGNQSAIFVTTGSAPETLRREFAKVELLKESYTVWRGQNIKKFKFYLCRELGGESDGEAR
ncbi:MAG: glycosyltransferase family 39 protein [Verrucomicrobiales bacterium]|jgi:4-amino-4-deoxy-L-arabinose transferase-like glycosyltransferase|nr:glycosyltransferase family 39 protein [Verrucomicrobiales bacterium]